MAEGGEPEDAGEGGPAEAEVARLVNRFIEFANRANQSIDMQRVHDALLSAAARYGAFLVRNEPAPDQENGRVREMAGRYEKMLRDHLGDPDLG